MTRTYNKPFGAYPYDATCLDIAVIAKPAEADSRVGMSFCLVGDALLDTVLLPIDLVFWSFGVHKDWLF